ncbi:substrate-binding domain-containing protein [Texcoconibacillus texcoconensis]|uniref:Tungstate transport system substrate-binding protein n=1 Tax=Texcoconibacillus texcoconensis TaxID=1095777 RepID=A0A840QPM0_9BACI|nr:substrate-binding domain-containing protein [Texcoconibacillus texcoconensis]MBB5173281.1 tungstate transport system substrate-binding protein [Texcoconibacillus texcoconensis]
MKKSLLAICSILFLTACQAEGETTDSNEANQNEMDEMILATTTSTYDSGLLDELVPQFEDEENVNVKIIAVGTGQALEMGERGEADSLLVHAPDAEKELVEGGSAINRQYVMYNDFVFLGPEEDPANVSDLDIAEGFQAIHEADVPFFSRGDDSGTHKKERSILEKADVETDFSNYEESGQGMGDTLRIAAERAGYILTDRGTYLSLEEQLETLDIVIEGDEVLENPYHVMQVNPDEFDMVNGEKGEAFVEFLLTEEIQDIIEVFGTEEYGEPLFFPVANE